MPTYTFEDKETGEVFDEIMKISEKEQYLKDNPNLKPVLTAPNFVGDHIITKMDGGMKETLQKIAERNPNTPLADRFSRKSIADQKKDRVVKKYNLDKQYCDSQNTNRLYTGDLSWIDRSLPHWRRIMKNPVTKNMFKFTRMLVVPDKKKAARKGYVKHKDKNYVKEERS